MPAVIDLNLIYEQCFVIYARYKNTAPTVSSWADNLYMRLQENARIILLDEIITLAYIVDNKLDGNTAANVVYKLYNRIGWDTTGMLGF